jgi:integrase
MRHGVYASQADADADLDAIRAALAVPEPADTAAVRLVGDLIESAVKAGEPIPTVDGVRRALHLDLTPRDLPTVGEYLTGWLTGRKTIKAGTRRSYESHIRLYLIPYLGHLRIDRLRAGHIDAMYDAIDERNAAIVRSRASSATQRSKLKGQRVVGPATQHRIHATLRKALNDAMRRDRLRDTNPALMIELPPAKPPKPTVWTAERVASWQRTGKIPSPVMVWTPQQTGAFLDHIHDADDRLAALYHLITFTGLRRGEACGVHWDDLDLDTRILTVRWQIVQHGWVTAMDTPKTDDSEASVSLDAETVAVLRAHRAGQGRERLSAGAGWIDTGLVFTTPSGGQLHPADVTDHFHHLAAQAGLPPIRLHDLRHGAATIGLAAGVQMKVISRRLRHASPTFTSKFYGDVLPELFHDAAAATAAVVPRRRRTPARSAPG